MRPPALPMRTVFPDQSIRATDPARFVALGSGALLLVFGASRRSVSGACLAASSAPFLYRGLTGRWPGANGHATDTRAALAGDRGIRVRESIRLEVPIGEVFSFWRRLDRLPRFMSHLERVTERSDGRSHWVASGPAGIRVQWDAEIVNEVENRILA